VTQLSVRAKGKNLILSEDPWLDGPTGGTVEIGKDFFAKDKEGTGELGEPGGPAHNIRNRASVTAGAPREEILKLIPHRASVAEIHNTLRRRMAITRTDCEIHEIQ
jgi:hypothetical protein